MNSDGTKECVIYHLAHQIWRCRLSNTYLAFATRLLKSSAITAFFAPCLYETSQSIFASFVFRFIFGLLLLLLKVNSNGIHGDLGVVSRATRNKPTSKLGRRAKVYKNLRNSPWVATLNRPVPPPTGMLASDWPQKKNIFVANQSPTSIALLRWSSYTK